MRGSLTILALCFVTVPTYDVAAQAMIGNWDIGSGPALALGDKVLSESLAKDMGRDARQAGAGPAYPRAQSENGATAYLLDPARARAAVLTYISRVRSRDKRAADEVATAIGRQDVGRVYQSVVAPFGLHRGDVADALTAYMLLGWMVANGSTEPTRAEVAAARREVAASVAINPQLATEIARAKLGDEMEILFVMLRAGWKSAATEGRSAAYSDQVTATFKVQLGRDLRRVALTDRGFEARG